jgi:small ligand-binding sensory domain FIST
MTEAQRRALTCVAAKHDTSVQQIIGSAINAVISAEMENDRILALAIAKSIGVTWEQLAQLKVLDDVNAGAALATA